MFNKVLEKFLLFCFPVPFMERSKLDQFLDRYVYGMFLPVWIVLEFIFIIGVAWFIPGK